jgi:hypothetical protein
VLNFFIVAGVGWRHKTALPGEGVAEASATASRLTFSRYPAERGRPATVDETIQMLDQSRKSPPAKRTFYFICKELAYSKGQHLLCRFIRAARLIGI